MKRFVMLTVLCTASCGRLFNVGDDSREDDLRGGGHQCGPTTCAAGTECCNASCGICVAPGGACTQQACLGPIDAGPACPAVVCTLACQYGFQTGANGCDICACNPPPKVQCGASTCDTGEECCNASCGICVPPGGACTQQACAPLDAGPACPAVACTLACQYGFQKGADGCEICACNPPPKVQCGPNTCDNGEECCNASCGICVPPGGACTQQACAPIDAGSPASCGFNTCAPGTECCNASCGICAPPGVACTQQACACSPVVCTLACQYGFLRGADGCEECTCAPPPSSCGTATCSAGQTCCNASCGICTPPGFACTQQACN